MTVVALILWAVAVMAAIVSALYARQQAQDTKRSVDIEAARRADELEHRRESELRAKQAHLHLHVHREENRDGSLAEGPFRYALVVTNDGPTEARDVEIEIISAWKNPLGTKACFTDGKLTQRVGRVPAVSREVLPLRDESEVDFEDIGECDVRWRDESTPELQQARYPARPDWL